MIKLQKPFEINKYYSTAKPAWWNVNPVCMPPPMNEENAAYYRPNAFFYKFGPLKVTGWGRLEENKPNKHLYFAGKAKICFIIDMPITTRHKLGLFGMLKLAAMLTLISALQINRAILMPIGLWAF